MEKHIENERWSGKARNGTPARNEILEKFIQDYGQRAFRFAYKLSGNVEDAQELVQEASYRVILAWASYDKSKSLQDWFFTILRNAFIDSQRRLRQRKWVALDAPVDGIHGVSYGDILSDGDSNPARRIEDAEVVRTVRRGFGRLSSEYQAVLHLCDVSGMKYEDIAQSLNIPVGTVRSRISRARRELLGSTGYG